MKFAILFQDNPEADPGLRSTYMAQHLEFLSEHATSILAAGPLKRSDGTIDGGLWLVEAESEAAARELVTTDPFWPTGLRASVDIRQWVQVFRDGQAQI